MSHIHTLLVGHTPCKLWPPFIDFRLFVIFIINLLVSDCATAHLFSDILLAVMLCSLLLPSPFCLPAILFGRFFFAIELNYHFSLGNTVGRDEGGRERRGGKGEKSIRGGKLGYQRESGKGHDC